MSQRYAIFFVPGDTTPLGEFGSSVLGRDANGDGVRVPESRACVAGAADKTAGSLWFSRYS